MEILVARHGETNWNVLGKTQGKTDIELNEKGKKQAEQLRDKLQNEKIDLIIASPLKRAKVTAEIVNRKLHTKLIEDGRLMERDFGDYEGLDNNGKVELRKKKPETEYIWDPTRDINVPNGETVLEFYNRVYSLLQEIQMKYDNKRILLVTHAGTTKVIRKYFEERNIDAIDEKGKKRDMSKMKNCEVIRWNII